MGALRRPCMHSDHPGNTVLALKCSAQLHGRPGVWIVGGENCPAAVIGEHGENAATLRQRAARHLAWVYLPGYRWDLCPRHAGAWTAAARSQTAR